MTGAVLFHLTRHRLGRNDKSPVEMTGRNGGPLQILDLANVSHEALVAKAAAFELPMNFYED